MPSPETPAATYPLPGSARITLTDQVIVRVSGAGTDKFLQGQFSQQMSDVTEHHAPRAAACSPKGRAYCLTRIVRDGEDALMAMTASLAEETITHLRKYLMLFRGTSMAVDTNATLTGLLGAPAAEALTEHPEQQLPFPGDTLPVPGGRLVRTMDTGDGLARFEFWQTGDLTAATLSALNLVPEENLSTWQASEIAAGVASLCPETRESYVPQMLNWQHLGGVHFKKGCYTGQEVIARMHFLGQLKKSLFRYSSTDIAQAPPPGSALEKDGRAVGDLVNSVQLSDGRFECLAVVRHDAAEPGLTLKECPDVGLQPLPLPYAVPEREPKPDSDT